MLFEFGLSSACYSGIPSRPAKHVCNTTWMAPINQAR